MNKTRKAPGRPGKIPDWTCGAKTAIGKALNAGSHISFSVSDGAITESYYPREDTACLGESFFVLSSADNHYISDERTDATHQTENFDPRVPGYIITNTARDGAYTIQKEIISDPLRNCLLQQVSIRFPPGRQLRVNCITTPRFPVKVKVRRAYPEIRDGIEMLFAETEGMVLAIACSSGFIRRTVGFHGKSDGYAQIEKHAFIKNEYTLAEDGNVGLGAEIELDSEHSFLLVTAFGHSVQEAAHSARASLLNGFHAAKEMYSAAWIDWHRSLWRPSPGSHTSRLSESSASVLRVSESKLFPGGILASLSIPWGSSRNDNSLGAYHMVWPRDLVLSAGGFTALNDREGVLRVLNYLMATQKEDGSWPQNMWLDGMPNWNGVQLDQVAMPVSLIDLCRKHDLLNDAVLGRYWPGIKKALYFLMDAGPMSEQDRWEEESGVNTYTLSSVITALVAGANLAKHSGEPDLQQKCLAEADALFSKIDELTYVTDTPLTKKYGIDGYYVRINPGVEPAERVKNKTLSLRKPGSRKRLKVYECIGIDSIALVRFGLRAADDPRIVDTVKIIDELLQVNFDNATGWRRYVGDVYGETDKGDPYREGHHDGIGRVWPLLTGERAHYEIAAGNLEKAKFLIESLDQFASNGFLPEQVWDQDDIPEKGLFKGKATGSAMPLTWAHAEYLKLIKSLEEGRIFDLHPDVYDRYVKKQTV